MRTKIARELIYNVFFCKFYERSSNVCKQEKKKALTFLMDIFIIHHKVANVHSQFAIYFLLYKYAYTYARVHVN